MVDAELGLAVCWNGCIYNYQRAAARAGAGSATGSSRTATPRCCSRPTTSGATDSSTACYGMFAFADRRARQRPGAARPRPAGHQAAVPDRDAGSHPLRARHCPRCWPAADVDTRIDPVALHHYLSFHSVVPPPRRSCAASRKVAARVAGARSNPTASRTTTTTYWEPDFTPARRQRRLVRTRLGGRGSRGAAARGRAPHWSPTCPSAACCRAASTRA